MEKSNIIIQYIVDTRKIIPKGLPHFGGNQFVYKSGNIDISKLGEIIYNMTDEEIELFIDYYRMKKLSKIKDIIDEKKFSG